MIGRLVLLEDRETRLWSEFGFLLLDLLFENMRN
jgi:hypothetical protein